MSELINRFWSEKDDIFQTTGKITEEINKGLLPIVFLYIKSPLGTNTPSLSGLENFPQKILTVKNQHKCK